MSSVRTRTPPPHAMELRATDAELKFKVCLEAAVDAVIVIDEDGLIEEFNQAAQRMFGYTLEEVVGLNVRMLMTGHDADRHDRYMSGYHDTGEAKIIGIGREVRARRRDGTSFPVKLSVGEALMPDGIRYVGVIHDLSEQRAIEDALRRSEAALQHAQEVAHIGNFDLEIPGSSHQVLSPQLMKILGVPSSLAEETADRLFSDIVHPDDRRLVRRTIEASAETGQKLDLQYRIQRPAGEVRTVQVMAKVSRAMGRLRVIGVLHDVTESRRVEEEARQARERLTHVGRLSTMGEMASGLAHELNQPLTAITAYAQAAMRVCEKDDGSIDMQEMRRVLDNIAGQALRAGNVIARMRDLVRNRQTAREVADCNGLVKSLVTLAEPDARAADVVLRLDLAQDLPAVEVDQVQIQQVLLNLVRNAIDATLAADAGVREVLIRTRMNEGRDVEVAVVDNGCGLPDTQLEKLCTPFYTTKKEGTGLGLSISQSILRAHGGTMRFANNPDGGATVTFTLPAKVDNQE
jgi:two-component system sensor kinase FixL